MAEITLSNLKVFVFEEEKWLVEKLNVMNYEDGRSPEIALVDSIGTVFIAAGTEEGDAMGIAYYTTNAEGYMYHYGNDGELYDEDNIRDWKPTFPCFGICNE